jgi:hypothetical protein
MRHDVQVLGPLSQPATTDTRAAAITEKTTAGIFEIIVGSILMTHHRPARVREPAQAAVVLRQRQTQSSRLPRSPARSIAYR